MHEQATKARAATAQVWQNVAEGQALPQLRIEFSITRIVAGALATRDYQPVHHDADLARRNQAEHVFSNTHTTAGCLERLVLEWAGADAFLRKLSLRLGVSHYPDDTLILDGTVRAIDQATRRVTVDAVGRNRLGGHVTVELVVQFPESVNG